MDGQRVIVKENWDNLSHESSAVAQLAIQDRLLALACTENTNAFTMLDSRTYFILHEMILEMQKGRPSRTPVETPCDNG